MDVLLTVFGATAFVFFVACCLPLFYDYQLSDDAVEIVLFLSLPVFRIPFDDIAQIEMSWGWGRSYAVLRIGNRPFSNGVLITRKGALLSSVAITPRDPEQFVRDVQSRIDGLKASSSR
jgi:hypothetical protein